MKKPAAKTQKILNLGPVSSGWLADIGVHDLETVQTLGVVEVYRRLKERFPGKINALMLYALHGAVDGLHWNSYPPVVKEQMRAEVAHIEAAASAARRGRSLELARPGPGKPKPTGRSRR